MARTARQRAALRKAQLASARKRRGKGKGKLAKAHRRARRNARIAVGTGVVAGVAVGLAGYKASGARLYKTPNPTGKRGRPQLARFGDRSGLASASTRKSDFYFQYGGGKRRR